MMDFVEFLTKELQMPKSFRKAANNITRIHKTTFFREARLVPAQQKLVDELVSEILVFGIAGENSNIPPVKNDERDYSEVLFIFCNMKITASANEMSEVILSSFEKPAVLFSSSASGKFSIHSARKRLSLGEYNRQVCEAFRHSHELDISSPTDMAYLHALAIPKMPLSNLFDLHDAIFLSIIQIDEDLREELDRWMARKPKKLPKLAKFIESAEEYGKLSKEARRLEIEHDEFRKNGEFGDALNIHALLTAKRKEMKGLLGVARKTFA